MTTKLVLHVPGLPVAKGRPRMMRNGHAYTPAKTRHWEAELKWLAKKASATMLEGPLALHVDAVFQIPESWPKWRTVAAEQGEVVHTTKPDLDNLIKIVGDGLNGIAYRDDSQICDVSASKRYGPEPGVWITLELVEKLHRGSKR